MQGGAPQLGWLVLVITCVNQGLWYTCYCIIYLYLYLYLSTYLPIYLSIYLPIYLPPTYLPTYIRTYIHTFIHSYIHSFIHSYIHTNYIYIYMYVQYTCIDLCIYSGIDSRAQQKPRNLTFLLHEKNQDLHLELSPVSLGALLSAVKGSESAGAWRRAWWMMQCHAGIWGCFSMCK